MKPWYVSISGPNIRIGQCATIIGEPANRVQVGVWGREPDEGKIVIGDYALISPGVRISASDEIIIGDNVMIANGAYITDADWHSVYDRSKRDEGKFSVHIGDNVWLGDHCSVLKGVSIGDNSIVAAGAVVTREVPPNVVVAGNPAKVVKQLDEAKGFVKRSDFFADPVGLEVFFDAVDKEVLSKNGFLNWIRTLIWPSTKD